MIRAVLDSNVIASGIVGDPARSASADLFRRWRMGEFELVVFSYILDEVARTLGNAWFRQRVSPEDRRMILRLIENDAVVTDLLVVVSGAAPHAKDDPVVATALSGGARHLVTGERRFREVGEYEGVLFRTPKEFQAVLGASSRP